MYSASRSILDLVIWSDKLVESGLLKRNRIIIPSIKRIHKLFSSVFKKDQLANDNATLHDGSPHQVYLGPSYNTRKNPEHLPPTTKFEALGEQLRKVPEFLGSTSSNFGFRCACAALSIGLLIFLRQTQKWSLENRAFWAVIMTSISMTPTSGQSLFGFFLRIGGTVIAMLVAWIIYYVPDNGNVPGVLVLYWFFVALGFYIPLKRPPLAAAGIITIVTVTLIIGYELEAIKLGKDVIATSSGQKYLGILVFGPARLATVLAGIFVAFIWTIFPYPISEHANLRRDCAGSLYLLANYYSLIHETVGARLRRVEGNMDDKNSPGRRLERARLKTFAKQILLIEGMKKYSAFTKWEVFIGGKFPKKEYDSIIDATQR
jgi:hypothetical protein